MTLFTNSVSISQFDVRKRLGNLGQWLMDITRISARRCCGSKHPVMADGAISERVLRCMFT
jgi:hypothetical protein